MDWGKFRDALDYGHHQLGISEELDNPQMRSEAYLNLARAHERLGEFIVLLLMSVHLCFNVRNMWDLTIDLKYEPQDGTVWSDNENCRE